MVEINPNESIYLDMYRWGLSHVEYSEIEAECQRVGKEIRRKDEENYWRGYYKSAKRDEKTFLRFKNASGTACSPVDKLNKSLDMFDDNPMRYGRGIEQRWVPCNEANKPMVKWGKQSFMHDDALAYPGCVYLAENLYQSQYIVIDCDGDHNDTLDLESIFALYNFGIITDIREKPKQIQEYAGYELTKSTLPASFHVTFKTDKIIPTIHCPWAHVDILGNSNNQLRYIKNKVWNGKEPVKLTPYIWDSIRTYLLWRKDKA